MEHGQSSDQGRYKEAELEVQMLEARGRVVGARVILHCEQGRDGNLCERLVGLRQREKWTENLCSSRSYHCHCY